MLIGYDISSALPPRTGIGNYTLNLARAMAQISEWDDKEIQLRFLLNSFRRRFPDEDRVTGKHCEYIRRRLPGPWLLSAWQSVEWPPVESLVGKVDLFHSPATFIPPQREGVRITTVHDLWFYDHPEHCDRWGGRYLARRLLKNVNKLDGVIAVSHFTAREVQERLNVPEERIHVVHSGVAPCFRKIDAKEIPRESSLQQLPDSYFLSVATLEPRKNIGGLLEGYQRLLTDATDAPPLVLVGMQPGSGPLAPNWLNRIKCAPLKGKVVFTGYIADHLLPAIYSKALLFILPSFCEGFGLPVLEAMACGAPVACSTGSALDEVGGEAAWRFDPYDPDSIADIMLTAISDTRAAGERVETGKRHVSKFRWDKCARETLDVYKKTITRMG